MDLTTGQAIGQLHDRHRATEFNQFPATIDREDPAELDVHVVLDNVSTHATPAIQKWLAAHARFVLHFTPTTEQGGRIRRWLVVASRHAG